MATRAASDRVFLTCLIPLAIATFLSGPLAVLHFHGHLDHALSYAFRHTAWSQDVVEEVPLLFHADAYPLNGKKTIALQDQRLQSLIMAFNASYATSPLPSTRSERLIIGYVPVNETLKLQSRDRSALLEGSLLRVNRQ
ncbi:hypothetical protein ATCC90586_009567 [Pythium insidiosum]|nr:hypothetical protein ATCC90586_009567 [Pythium insidiosum]